MCGRYSQTADVKKLAKRFGICEPGPELERRYNLAPGDRAPVVIGGGEANELRLMQWGLVPSWAQDPKIGQRMINARSETLAEKPSFRRPLAARRCLVPADGFYEWRGAEGGRRKVPVRIVLAQGGIFAFAGLWDVWKRPAGGVLESFTIVTTRANEMLAAIHDRMPVILRPEDEAVWVDPEAKDIPRLLALLAPYPAGEMKFYEVSPLVNSPRNDVPKCIEPA